MNKITNKLISLNKSLVIPLFKDLNLKYEMFQSKLVPHFNHKNKEHRRLIVIVWVLGNPAIQKSYQDNISFILNYVNDSLTANNIQSISKESFRNSMIKLEKLQIINRSPRQKKGTSYTINTSFKEACTILDSFFDDKHSLNHSKQERNKYINIPIHHNQSIIISLNCKCCSVNTNNTHDTNKEENNNEIS